MNDLEIVEDFDFEGLVEFLATNHQPINVPAPDWVGRKVLYKYDLIMDPRYNGIGGEVLSVDGPIVEIKAGYDDLLEKDIIHVVNTNVCDGLILVEQ